jgi:Ca-activated chloride channel family protein
MKALQISCVVVVAMWWAGIAFGDGFLVAPHPDEPVYDVYNVKYHRVDVEIEGQIARTTIDQVFENPGRREIEVVYLFPIPPGASISSFSMLVGGTELKGEILDKDEARRIYEDIVRKKRDPALLEYVGGGLIKTSAFPIPPGETRTNRVVYEEVLRRDGDLVEYIYPLNTEKFSAQNLEEVTVNVSIASTAPITNVFSPTHPVRIERFTDHRATATWTERDTKPDIDYRLYYSTSERDVGASVICYRPDANEFGYFLLLASPKAQLDEASIVPKNLICVIDRSGSMSGEKIEQAKGALTFVINSLNADDCFALVSYSDSIDLMKPELVANTKENREAALKYVEDLSATGGTNIRDALVEALKLAASGDRPNIIIFLTDGLPTIGETDVGKIAEAVAAANTLRARLFVFGVGYDVNAVLLDKLSSQNHGVSEYVRPKEDIEVKVSSFYAKVQSPVLTDIAIDFGTLGIKDVFPTTLPDLFKGGQLVVAGRYTEPSGLASAYPVTIKGRLQGKEAAFEYMLPFKHETDSAANNFIARIWASRKIGYLIDQMRIHGESEEVVDEIVRLSKEFGIITEYTSFLVETDVELEEEDAIEMAKGAFDSSLVVTTGSHGVAQAQNVGRMQRSDQVNLKNVYYDASGRQVQYDMVRNVGAKAFYRREAFWVDAAFDKETQEPIEIEQFSEEFFELSRKLGRDNQYLSFAGNIIVVLDGQAYKIVPAESPDDALPEEE